MKEQLLELINHMDKTYPTMDGMEKVAMLKTVGAYFENLTQMQAQNHIITTVFKDIMK